ncbi:MAG: DNA gyrase subunit A [Verrucomicrobia bacterium]|nr:DNA gyrase subunit A [Verrucomicrobiota bacterium]
MSVIISRALPDARDGLKPSQRRILFAMSELGVMPTRKHLKCAKIVGETMGNYHPHGDQAIYPTLVHMAQKWAMRETLIEGQGNFGSVEGDPPASMRYTEARLRPLGAILMEDMDHDTVNFVPNYDDTREEPTVFPAAIPNLLVNGGTGIAVGMATNIIVITEIPYNVNRATLVERIAGLVNEKIITDISAIRDESDENTRVVVELKRDALPKVVINNLYKHTALESSFSISMLAIDRGRPKLLSLKEAIACFIEHRREVILRRTRFLLREAEGRAEKLEGYLIALANLDQFIKIIRDSQNRDEARTRLLALTFTKKEIEKFGILLRHESRLNDKGEYCFSEPQTDAILELRLYQLTGLERDKLSAEYQELLKTIKDLLDILAREDRVLSIIKNELKAIKEKHAGPRLTELIPEEGEISIEDLIANEGCIITVTHKGFIKRTAVSAYRSQRRGGKGVIGMTTREAQNETEEGDFVEHLFTASTHDYLVFFTKTGRCYVERVHEIPEMSRTAKGRSIANILNFQTDEQVAATLRVEASSTGGVAAVDTTWNPAKHILFATRSGIVKKSNLEDFANIRKGGIIAIKIEEGDELISAIMTDGQNEVVLVTRQGMSIRFSEEELRDQARATVGVWGIRPDKGDYVVSASIVRNDCTLLVAGDNGIGKRTPFEDYRKQTRGGKGVITMKTGEKTGLVVGALSVTSDDELMLITSGGQMVRTRVAEIREAGRNTMGVKLIGLPEGEKLQRIAPVVSQKEDEVVE